MKTLRKEGFKDLMNKDIVSLKKSSKRKHKASKLITNKTVVVCDIGSKDIKVVEGKVSRGAIKINKMFSLPTPRGSVSDGSIGNEMALTKTLQDMIINKGIKTSDVIMVNNSTSIITRELSIPKVQEEDLTTLVSFEIQKFLPINMNDYIVQYYDLKEEKEEDKLKVLAITYPRRMAKQYYDLCNNCKLNPVALDITFNSIRKLIGYSLKEKILQDGTYGFIDLGYENIYVNIYDEGEMKFTRIIKAGGKQLDEALGENYNITLKEAEEKKIAEANFREQFLEEKTKEANDIMKEKVNEWIEDIRKILEFYRNKTMNGTIKKIYIYGGCARIEGLDRYMERILGTDVETLDSMENVIINNKEENTLGTYLNALGALLRYEKGR